MFPNNYYLQREEGTTFLLGWVLPSSPLFMANPIIRLSSAFIHSFFLQARPFLYSMIVFPGNEAVYEESEYIYSKVYL